MIKRQLSILALALDGAALALMTRVQSILIYSATSPTELIPHYYTYLDPAVSLGSGIMTAPLAVALVAAALLLLGYSILRPAASAKPAFWAHAAALACVFPVVVLLPVHTLNLGILALLVGNAFLLHRIAFRLPAAGGNGPDPAK